MYGSVHSVPELSHMLSTNYLLTVSPLGSAVDITITLLLDITLDIT